ncbi:TraB/GumN family protein [Sphingomonas parva]|uniref:TraB/GumN family protein n=1 Tax=Sphingomonas parva TaxID=2555898 RepID=A0A4Y8ZQW9_9SPHN|nr:TraB/GumN family protein [Sphingomonas parva]TFI57857.1 TraB/GumN family protein [Sphingomonas parva]
MLKAIKTGLLGGIAVALALSGCASAPVAESNAAPGAARPAMWKLADEDTTIYLFGTFHLLPPELQWRTAAFDTALATADELVFEIANLDDQAAAASAMTRLGLSSGLPPLRERVPEEKRAALDAMVKDSGIPAAALDRFETWAAALALVSVTFKQLGVSGEAGVEKSLGAGYKASGKPVLGLETIEQQLGLFDRLPEEAQRTFLVGVLESPEDLREQFRKMLDAWSRGDEAGIAATFDEDAKLSPTLRQALLTDRNARWAEWLDARMDRPGTVFVAVGAGHLAGRDSVQSMLRSKGLKAKRIQ